MTFYFFLIDWSIREKKPKRIAEQLNSKEIKRSDFLFFLLLDMSLFLWNTSKERNDWWVQQNHWMKRSNSHLFINRELVSSIRKNMWKFHRQPMVVNRIHRQMKIKIPQPPLIRKLIFCFEREKTTDSNEILLLAFVVNKNLTNVNLIWISTPRRNFVKQIRMKISLVKVYFCVPKMNRIRHFKRRKSPRQARQLNPRLLDQLNEFVVFVELC